MTLVDIGNTRFHIFDGKTRHLVRPEKIDDEVYYISVNEQKEREFLKLNPNAVNLKNYVRFNSEYANTLGIDRIMACKTVENGIVVDAGTFITLDIMHNSVHKGGVIMPGIRSLREIYKKSKVLDFDFVYPVSNPPKNTLEAISEGSIGMVVEMIKKYAKDEKIYFTGGDGEFFAKILNGIYIEDLIFKGMMKTIKEDL